MDFTSIILFSIISILSLVGLLNIYREASSTMNKFGVGLARAALRKWQVQLRDNSHADVP
jgi:hypothetical protein